ncbi:MAG: hypothetical protein R3253_13170 [Longimicrobiales bacterium]|nr:hypothetical protein [Longimicrobiales bacterium]
MNLRELQERMRPWVEHNFPDQESWQPLLGAVEELGELAHAHLKASQGIRTAEDHEAGKRDAVADVIIYLTNYCIAEGIDIGGALREVWQEVERRDWRSDPEGAAENLAEAPPHLVEKALAMVPAECPGCGGRDLILYDADAFCKGCQEFWPIMEER